MADQRLVLAIVAAMAVFLLIYMLQMSNGFAHSATGIFPSSSTSFSSASSVRAMGMMVPEGLRGHFSVRRQLPLGAFRRHIDTAANSGNGGNGGFAFFVIGDFGTGDKVQRRVAHHLSKVAVNMGSHHLILSTGDNAYGRNDVERANGLDGVASATDRKFQLYFEDVYPGLPGLVDVPWFLTLGNHDCAGNSEAQVQYRSKAWHMPAKYYSFERHLFSAASSLAGSGAYNRLRVKFIVLDTCSLVCTNPDVPGLKVNKRCGTVKTGDNAERERQLDWLDTQLSSTTRENGFAFVIVSTHWSMFSVMGNGPTEVLQRDLLPRLKRVRNRGLSVLWFNGHDHSLQSHRLTYGADSHSLHFFVSGGGGFHTHPVLKKNAEGAYTDLVGSSVGGKIAITGGNSSTSTSRGGGGSGRISNLSILKSTLNEIPGLVTQFASAMHGFLRVVLDEQGNKAVVEFYASLKGKDEATLIRTEEILSNDDVRNSQQK